MVRASSLTAFALALAACTSTGQDQVAGATGALEAAPTSTVEAPVVVDSARVDRADDALRVALAAIDDPEARLAARFEQFQVAEVDVRRDGELDTRSVIATAAALRARLLDSPEARRDSEEADRARSARGEGFVPTSADLAAFEQVRAQRDARFRERAVAPTELWTPDGIPTQGHPPTAEELRHETH